MQLIWVCWNWSEDLSPEKWERGCFFFMLLLPNPIVGGGRGREGVRIFPVETNHRENCHLLTALLRWHRVKLGEKWKESEIGENAVEKIQVWKLISLLQFPTSALLKGMTREDWWGWRNINCQVRGEEEGAPGLASYHKMQYNTVQYNAMQVHTKY